MKAKGILTIERLVFWRFTIASYKGFTSSCCPFGHHHGVCKAGAIISAENKAVIISLTDLLGQTIYQKKDQVIDAGPN